MTSRLPVLVSVPHAGLSIPDEIRHLNRLSDEEIADDGDRGAREIYLLDSEVDQFVTTDVARAFVDMNRSRTDRSKDGVVKTHTCWDIPVYNEPLSPELVETLLDRYHRPYHERLSKAAGLGLLCGLDCHTMASSGPPVGPDPGTERPAVCLSNANGATFPNDWLEQMADCFRHAYHHDVSLNSPFKGGFITREHGREMPWLQIELSRKAIYPVEEKRIRVLESLRLFVERVQT